MFRVSSTVTVTVRCAGCSSPLAMYYALPRGPEARERLAAVAKDLAEWHAKLRASCAGKGTRLSERADPR
jgi:hypothetical protein